MAATAKSLCSSIGAALLLILISVSFQAIAEDVAGFTIGGQVKTPQHFSAQDLEKFPTTQVSVSFVTGHGQEGGSYSGVLLWTLLGKAELANGPEKGALLKHVIVVTGRDGYAIALSAGELAPEFENKSVILATERDGKPIPTADGIRLIVPGDKHGGRAVRDVAKVDVQ